MSEGYFTRLPPELFPIRGFSSNLIEAPEAAASGIEVFWPLANLQMGTARCHSFYIAWGSFSALQIGVAWPLICPEYVKDNGAKFVIQLGRPL